MGAPSSLSTPTTSRCPDRGSSYTHRTSTRGLSPRVRGNRLADREAAVGGVRAGGRAARGRPDPGDVLSCGAVVWGGRWGTRNRPKAPASGAITPRVRGNRLLAPRHPRSVGSIPACAGVGHRPAGGLRVRHRSPGIRPALTDPPSFMPGAAAPGLFALAAAIDGARRRRLSPCCSWRWRRCSFSAATAATSTETVLMSTLVSYR